VLVDALELRWQFSNDPTISKAFVMVPDEIRAFDTRCQSRNNQARGVAIDRYGFRFREKKRYW